MNRLPHLTRITTMVRMPKVYSDLEWDGIDHRDYPDYCDAYVVRGMINGREMTEEELEELNDGPDKLDLLMEHLY